MLYFDLTNQHIGNFVVISKAPPSRWLCRCSCGNIIKLRRARIFTQLSCNKCPNKGKYKELSLHYLYKMWRNIHGRCYCKGQTHYQYYGGKGIEMNTSWKKDYRAFYYDILQTLGERPSSEHTLDRIDPDKHYQIDNLRWASRSLQMKNRKIKIHK